MPEEGSGGAGAPQTPRRRRGFWIRLGLGIAVVAAVLAVAVGQIVVDGDGSKTPSTDLAAATERPRRRPRHRPPSRRPRPRPSRRSHNRRPALLPPVPGGLAEVGQRARPRSPRTSNGSSTCASTRARSTASSTRRPPTRSRPSRRSSAGNATARSTSRWSTRSRRSQYPRARVKPRGRAPTGSRSTSTRQVLTVYKGHQVARITTTSTGTGRKFCGGADGCQYAITPAGTYEFQRHVNGWRDGDLGRLYNPWYFNGGIAVHGYSSVPTQPASHGCARIPMHVAEYFGDPRVRRHARVRRRDTGAAVRRPVAAGRPGCAEADRRRRVTAADRGAPTAATDTATDATADAPRPRRQRPRPARRRPRRRSRPDRRTPPSLRRVRGSRVGSGMTTSDAPPAGRPSAGRCSS